MVEKIRRVVTGHDENGKSVFIIDSNAPAVKEMDSMPGARTHRSVADQRRARRQYR